MFGTCMECKCARVYLDGTWRDVGRIEFPPMKRTKRRTVVSDDSDDEAVLMGPHVECD